MNANVARQAAELVEVEYEPLPAIKTVKEAIAANSYHSDSQFIRRGDPDAVIAQAEHTFTGEVEIGGQSLADVLIFSGDFIRIGQV